MSIDPCSTDDVGRKLEIAETTVAQRTYSLAFSIKKLRYCSSLLPVYRWLSFSDLCNHTFVRVDRELHGIARFHRL